MRLLTILLLGAGACFRDLSESSDSAGSATTAATPIDSAVALAVDSTSLPAVSQLPPAVDSVRAPAEPPSPSTTARARPTERDTGSTVATTSELDQLSSVMTIPVQGVTVRDLRDTFTESRGTRPHDAIDIPAPRGTPVLAATDGRLLKLFASKPGGLMVYASDPSDRFILMYGHLDGYADGLTEGMALKRGQVIGYVGTTGNAPIGTPHLHFAIARGRPSVSWWKGTAVNPYPLLARAP